MKHTSKTFQITQSSPMTLKPFIDPQIEPHDENSRISSNIPSPSLSPTMAINNDRDPLNPNISSLSLVQKDEEASFKGSSTKGQQDHFGDLKGNIYGYRFSIKVFLEYFLYHLLFFLIGPLVVIITPITGYTVLYNQRFVGLGSIAFTQYGIFLSFFVFSILFNLLDDPGVYIVEVYMGLTAAVIRIITIASKYAHSSEVYLTLMKQKKLSEADITSQLMLRAWITQIDDTIELELQSTILRLELDISLFYFNFIGEAPAEYQLIMLKSKSLRPNQNISQHVALIKPKRVVVVTPESKKSKLKERSTLELSDEAINNESTLKGINARNAVSVASAFAFSQGVVSQLTTEKIKKSFANKYLQKETVYDKNQFYGYNVAFHLLQKARKIRRPYLSLIFNLVSLIHGLLPFFYRLYVGLPFLSDAPYISLPLLLCNFVFFTLNTRIISNTIEDLEMRVFLVKEIGDFISPKRMSHYFNREKEYTSFNFFDPITLKTWSNLRKILLHYGDKYVQRNSVNVSLAMIFYSFVLVVLVLHIFGITPMFVDDVEVYLLVFSYETAVYLGILLLLIYYGAFINDQFRVHKNFLKQNKTIIGDLMRLSYAYLGENSVEPEGYFYREGLKLLKIELGEESFEEKLEERAEKLMSMIDDMIEELDFEEANNSFKVISITMSYEILKTIVFGILSLLFAVGQKLIAS